MRYLLPLVAAAVAELGTKHARRWTNSTATTKQVLACTLLAAASGCIPWLMPELPLPRALATAALFGLLATTTLTEITAVIVPNDLVITALIVALIPGLFESTLIDGMFGSLLLFGTLLTIHLVTSGRIGLGGVKMSAAIGLLLGWQLAIPWLISVVVISLIIVVANLVMKLRGQLLPTSPIFMAGMAIALLIGR